jgi:hypothetical protein
MFYVVGNHRFHIMISGCTRGLPRCCPSVSQKVVFCFADDMAKYLPPLGGTSPNTEQPKFQDDEASVPTQILPATTSQSKFSIASDPKNHSNQHPITVASQNEPPEVDDPSYQKAVASGPATTHNEYLVPTSSLPGLLGPTSPRAGAHTTLGSSKEGRHDGIGGALVPVSLPASSRGFSTSTPPLQAAFNPHHLHGSLQGLPSQVNAPAGTALNIGTETQRAEPPADDASTVRRSAGLPVGPLL